MANNSEPLRVRFAPSPTGELHLGGARTALFNYLLAKKTGGQFIIRLEDTDQNRFIPGSADRLLSDLAWLGLDWDEGPIIGGGFKGNFGPYIQSERLNLYRDAVDKLLAAGLAYEDYLTPDELASRRELAQKTGVVALKALHLGLDLSEEKNRRDNQAPKVIRLKTPTEGDCTFNDAIRGSITVPWSQIDDQVLLKSDGYPTYHLAVVVDDHAMNINLVLRAEEWLPSTPKHLFLYQALGWEPPKFGHLPLILNSDRSKMSKRKDGDRVWISSYRDQGYLPTAMVNFLALLGWHESGDREKYSLNELIQNFSLERVQKSGAIFNEEKLKALNLQYIKDLSSVEFETLALPFVTETISQQFSLLGPNVLSQTIKHLQARVQVLSDIPNLLSDFLYLKPEITALNLIGKNSTLEITQQVLEKLSVFITEKSLSGLEPERIKSILDTLAQDNNWERGQVLSPLRLALSGKIQSIDPFTLLSVLPVNESLKRLNLAREILISYLATAQSSDTL